MEEEARDSELHDRLQQHDQYFYRMIQLIPHELYKHTDSMTGYHDDSETEDVQADANNNKYYKHRKQPLTADERKLKSIENKKRKYSSENAGNERPSAAEIDESEGEKESNNIPEPAQKKQKLHSASEINGVSSGDKMDELRKRLQERITSLKEQRQTKNPQKLQQQKQKQQQQAKQEKANKNKASTNKKPTTDPTKQQKTQSQQQQRPRSFSELSADSNRSAMESVENTIDRLKAELLSNQRDYTHSQPTTTPASDSLEGDFEFNQINQQSISSSSQDYRKAGVPNAGGAKKQRLQRLLQEAEKKRQRYQQLAASDNPIEKQKLQSEQWNDVLAVAAGKKALLVTGASGEGTKSELKIKKALKKLEKKKEKSAQQWKDRLTTLESEKQQKQQKREENIQKYKKHMNVEETPANTTTSAASNTTNAATATNKVKIHRPGHNSSSNNTHNNSSSNNSKGGANNNHHHNSNNNNNNKKPNRAGFEGKKSDGKFLNAK